MEKIEIKQKLGAQFASVLFVTLIALLFAVFYLPRIILSIIHSPGSFLEIILGNLSSIVIFTASIVALCVVIPRLISNFYDRPNALVIDSDGFLDCTPTSGVGFVPWKLVRKIGIYKLPTNRAAIKDACIGVTIDKLDTFLEKLSPAKRNAILKNMDAGFPPIEIRLLEIKGKPDDILAILQRYFDASRMPAKTHS